MTAAEIADWERPSFTVLVLFALLAWAVPVYAVMWVTRRLR